MSVGFNRQGKVGRIDAIWSDRPHRVELGNAGLELLITARDGQRTPFNGSMDRYLRALDADNGSRLAKRGFPRKP